jgi:hypothetical protein
VLANDARLPEYSSRELLGEMHPTDYPVKTPTPNLYAEALAMLYYRDGVPGPTIRGEYWLDRQSELVQTGLVKLDELPVRIKRHYELEGNADMNQVHRYSEEVAGQMRNSSFLFVCCRLIRMRLCLRQRWRSFFEIWLDMLLCPFLGVSI